MSRKIITILSISLALLIPLKGQTETLPECQLRAGELEERVWDCEALAETAHKTIQLQSEVIATQGNQIADLKFNYNIVKAQLDDQKVWYREPAIVVPLSFILGALTMSQVSK